MSDHHKGIVEKEAVFSNYFNVQDFNLGVRITFGESMEESKIWRSAVLLSKEDALALAEALTKIGNKPLR